MTVDRTLKRNLKLDKSNGANEDYNQLQKNFELLDEAYIPQKHFVIVEQECYKLFPFQAQSPRLAWIHDRWLHKAEKEFLARRTNK